MKRNSEGIYGSRPWKIYGEGPSTLVKPGAGMNEDKQPDLTAQDVRFTTKGGFVYAFIQGWPEGECILRALGRASVQNPGRVVSVEMLGDSQSFHFKQEDSALRVVAPSVRPAGSNIGVTLRIRLS
jgi:alpha-L-fucosidase